MAKFNHDPRLVEAIARKLAGLEPGEPWPSNDDLGGNHFTGTRDDEYHAAHEEDAKEILDILGYPRLRPSGVIVYRVHPEDLS